MEKQRNPNEPIKPTATGQEGGQQGGGGQQGAGGQQGDRRKQERERQQREREKQGGQQGGPRTRRKPTRRSANRTISLGSRLSQRREATPAALFAHKIESSKPFLSERRA